MRGGAPRYVVAGDIGGTHSLVELFEQREGITAAAPLCACEYLSADYASFDALLDAVLARPDAAAARGALEAACFSVAGPVEGNSTRLTNLDWTLDGAALGARFAIPEVTLVNDFAAIGHGIAALGEHDLTTLQRGAAQPHGTLAIVGAGTGLGVCTLTWQDGAYAVHASEAGHADFAATDPQQDALLAGLREAFGRVSCERVVSGPGLLRIFTFLENSGAGMASRGLREAMQRGDPSAAISEAALGRSDPLAVRALDTFIAAYGAFAGNIALATLARGGVYIAGGIARKITARLEEGGFMRAFADKGRFGDMLRRYPVHVVTDRRAGLKGALQLMRGGG